ncbi:hypothetical protein RF11_08499 [Thelohanellus kitauei]|uniref:Uncharacterized protein n=1 Tax=Thelohanellus kitauei TaxID=669202 RepID=A0A0C2MMF5_THEKT|nr:hypothetical protein RF11_08499 [Thelohanellus kitauei]
MVQNPANTLDVFNTFRENILNFTFILMCNPNNKKYVFNKTTRTLIGKEIEYHSFVEILEFEGCVIPIQNRIYSRLEWQNPDSGIKCYEQHREQNFEPRKGA